MSGDGRRAKRVAELLRAELTDLVIRALGDPALAGLVVTTVVVTDDLSIARIGVRHLAERSDEKSRARVLSSIARAAPRLRRALAPRLELRRVPELRFEYDLGQDRVERVDEILAEIARERGEGEE